MTTLKAFLISLFAVISFPAIAGTSDDALSVCLADNTTGRDRKDLAKFFFIAMTTHPDMQSLSAVSDKAREETFRSVGRLVTRLLTESCVEPTRAAAKNEGSAGFQRAFGVLGQLAMQEIMTNSSVTSAIRAFEPHVDMNKLQSTFGNK